MTSISPKSHPELTPQERRELRAKAEAGNYTLQFATLRLVRREDGKPGSIRVCYVLRPGACYTVRLRPNGDGCHCDCRDFTRRLEQDGHAAAPCKHVLLVNAANQPPARTPYPTPLQRWSARALETPEERDARILKDRDLLWGPD